MASSHGHYGTYQTPKVSSVVAVESMCDQFIQGKHLETVLAVLFNYTLHVIIIHKK